MPFPQLLLLVIKEAMPNVIPFSLLPKKKNVKGRKQNLSQRLPEGQATTKTTRSQRSPPRINFCFEKVRKLNIRAGKKFKVYGMPFFSSSSQT